MTEAKNKRGLRLVFFSSSGEEMPRLLDEAALCHLEVRDISALSQEKWGPSFFLERADIGLLLANGKEREERENLFVALCRIAAIPHLIVINSSTIEGSVEEGGEKNDPLSETGRLQRHELSHDSLEDDPDQLSDLLARLADERAGNTPGPEVVITPADQFAVFLGWFSKHPLLPRRTYILESDGGKTKASISLLKYRFDLEGPEHISTRMLSAGELGYANISLLSALPLASERGGGAGGTFVLRSLQTGEIVGGGLARYALRRSANITWQPLSISKAERAAAKGQKPCVLWLTGLSASGKSSIAALVECKLHETGHHTYVLDGDNLRHGLCRDLGFTEADRVENMRRIAETARLFVDAGLIVIASFISPFCAEREAARQLFAPGEFIEIHVDTPLEICEARDPKGLYKKARAGQLKNFTGIDSPYEAPVAPEIRLAGGNAPVDELAGQVIDEIKRRGLL